MRWLAVALPLALMPLSGCVSHTDLAYAPLGMFSLKPLERGDPTPQPPVDCHALLAILNDRALTETRVALEQSVRMRTYGYGPRVLSGATASASASATAAAAMDSAGASGGGSAPAAGAEVTGTNNQEAAADEADLVKTDGEWTYVLEGGHLYILHSAEVGDIERRARIDLDTSWGGQLLLENRGTADPVDDRLVVITSAAAPPNRSIQAGLAVRDSYTSMTHVVVLGLADRTHPTVIEEQWIEGNPTAGRLVDGTVYVVAQTYSQGLGLIRYAWPDDAQLADAGLTREQFYRLNATERLPLLEEAARLADLHNQRLLRNATLADHLPQRLHTVGGWPTAYPVDDAACSHVLSPPTSTGRAVSTILALAVRPERVATSSLQVVGGSGIVYANADSLVLAAPSQDLWWYYEQPDLVEATDLTWFHLDGLKLTLVGAGRVVGTVQDSFGLDVHGNQLRVATTTGTWGRWWSDRREPMVNAVALLSPVEGQLLQTGIVGGIAPGERLWSVRFTDTRAYLVTFRQMDPLWVVDVSGPVPRILGELEIPGVSTYIHPIGNGLLLTVGMGPRENGNGADWGRPQVSLFDVSDPKHPVRSDVLDLRTEDGWAYSSSLHEHKAFTYWDRLGVLALPLSTTRQSHHVEGGRDTYTYDHHVGLELVDVDAQHRHLSIRGEVSQDALASNATTWWGDVERSYFLGYPDLGIVSVYAVGPLGVTAHDLQTLQAQGATAFDAPDYGRGCCYID